MITKNKLPLFLLIIFFPLIALGKDDFRKEYDGFLRTLGFEDYSEQIDHELKSGNHGSTDVAKTVMEFNRERYKIFNYSRDLAVEILDSLKGRIHHDSVQEQVSKLNARLLDLNPVLGPGALPPEITNISNAAKKEEKALEYISRIVNDKIQLQTQAITTDIVEVIYGKDGLARLGKLAADKKRLPKADLEKIKQIEKIESLVNKIVSFQYLDGEMGTTKYLGRALNAGLTKLAKEKKLSSLSRKMQKYAKTQGIELENFIGNTVVMPNESGQMQKMHLKTGDFIMERSIGQEAGQITFAARPGSIGNYFRALRMRLLGHFLATKAPEVTNGAMSFTEMIKNKFAESDFATRGMSHVGIADVRKDPKTGISMLWGLDNYPNAGEGGIRIMGIPDTFARRGEYLRFAYSRYDAKAFHAWVKEQAKKKGYQEIAWIGDKEFLDKNGKPIPNIEPKKDVWLTKISQDEFKRLTDMPMDKAEEAFAEYMKRITNHIRTEYLVRDPIGFAYGFSNFKGRGYCTFTVACAAMQAVGADLQKVPDDWDIIVKIMHKMGSEDAKVIEKVPRIMAPAGFAWQDMTGKMEVVTYPKVAPEVRAKLDFRPDYYPISEKAEGYMDMIRVHYSVPSNNVQANSALVESVESAIRGARTKAVKSAASSGHSRAHSGGNASFIDNCAILYGSVAANKQPR